MHVRTMSDLSGYASMEAQWNTRARKIARSTSSAAAEKLMSMEPWSSGSPRDYPLTKKEPTQPKPTHGQDGHVSIQRVRTFNKLVVGQPAGCLSFVPRWPSVSASN